MQDEHVEPGAGHPTADRVVRADAGSSVRGSLSERLAMVRSPVDDVVLREPQRTLVEGANRIHFSNGSATASKQLWVKRPLAVVAPMLDPRSWPLRSPFFLETRKLESPYDPGPPGTVSWHGRLLEIFVVDFQAIRLNRFEVTLDVDVTITPDCARTDYALVHEKNDRLLLDDGYLAARKVPGHPGWTAVDGTKAVKFRSLVSNLLAPLGCLMLAAQDPLRIFTAPE